MKLFYVGLTVLSLLTIVQGMQFHKSRLAASNKVLLTPRDRQDFDQRLPKICCQNAVTKKCEIQRGTCAAGWATPLALCC
ncbi:unnamed protein product [Sympodiomycopsis kandeliae]